VKSEKKPLLYKKDDRKILVKLRPANSCSLPIVILTMIWSPFRMDGLFSANPGTDNFSCFPWRAIDTPYNRDNKFYLLDLNYWDHCMFRLTLVFLVKYVLFFRVGTPTGYYLNSLSCTLQGVKCPLRATQLSWYKTGQKYLRKPYQLKLFIPSRPTFNKSNSTYSHSFIYANSFSLRPQGFSLTPLNLLLSLCL